MKKIKIYLSGKVVEVELVQDRPRSVIVKLSDGNVIVRKKSRYVVKDA